MRDTPLVSVPAVGSSATARPLPGGPVASPWLTRWAVAVTAIASLVCLVVPASRGSLLVASGLAGGGVAVLCASRARGADRLAWRLFGCGQIANGLGNIAIAVNAKAWFMTGDNVSAVVFTVATVLTACGFVALLLPPGRARLTAGVDGALVLGSTFVVGWYYDAQRLVSDDTHTLPSLTGLVGADLDLLMLVVGGLVWWGRPSGQRWAPRLAVVAQLSATLGDLGVLQRFLPVPAGDLELTWLLSSCLFGLGALRLPRRGSAPLRVINRDRALTVVTVVVAACVVGVLAGAGRGLDRVSVVGWTLIVLLLLIRQGHAVRRARRLARELARSERHLRHIVEEMRDAIIQLDADGRIAFVSPAVRHLIGQDVQAALGRPLYDFLHSGDVALARAAVHEVGSGVLAERRLTLRMLGARGEIVHTEAVMTVMGSGVLVSVRDVTDRMRLEAQLHAAAYQDQLTGLPNRAHFDRELAARFAEGAASPPGIIFLDLDGFKRINDSSGHPAGDAVLIEAARRIGRSLRPGDEVARFGGDEFTVLLAPGTTAHEGARLAEAIQTTLASPLVLDGYETAISATAGVAVGLAPGPAELVRNADLAMYSVKGTRRGGVGVFEPVMFETFARRVELERRFSRAHDSGELSLAYQPIIDLETGDVVAAEALLRWRDEDGVVVGAEEFVPLAEGFGSIVAIGAWVLSEAAQQAARWARSGHPISVSVNVSARQLLDAALLVEVERALAEADLPAHRLCLEITESVLLADDEIAAEVLGRLSQLGVRLAIDDFGTGYSGLTYLRRLPVDQIKIDQSFLAGASGSGGDGHALLAGVVGLGRDLGLTVTVEGVETAEQVETLRALRAHRGQGFYLSRPLSEDAMLACLAWPRSPDGETPRATG